MADVELGKAPANRILSRDQAGNGAEIGLDSSNIEQGLPIPISFMSRKIAIKRKSGTTSDAAGEFDENPQAILGVLAAGAKLPTSNTAFISKCSDPNARDSSW
jgi:hypothetical protein